MARCGRPHETELELLKCELDLSFGENNLGQGLELMAQLAGQVTTRQSMIEDLTLFAVDHFLREEVDERFVDNGLELTFADGIIGGMDFFIGCMTYTKLLRTGIPEVNSLDTNDLPIHTRQQKRRARLIRVMGTTHDDETWDELVNIAREDYAEFAYDNYVFAALLQHGRYDLGVSEETPASRHAFSEGYHDGMEFGLQLYLQSSEEASRN